MIISSILNLLKLLITTIFGVLPNIPNIPSSLSNSIDSFLDLIFNNCALLDLFVPISTIKIAIPIAIVIINFDHIYKITMWIIKKIPILGVN